MAENAGLIETSFADAIEIIAASPELPEQTRRHWMTSLRQIAKALDRPLEVIPARYSAVRADLLNLHEVPAGLTAKTLQNHKSNVKAALLWLTREKGIPEHGAPLSPEWTALKDEIASPQDRWRLSSFWRYCSANNIKPSEVDEEEEIVERFLAYRTLCGKPADAAFRRLMARAWNGNVGKIAGWPTTRLFEPPVKSAVEVPWLDFADGLRHGSDAYLARTDKNPQKPDRATHPPPQSRHYPGPPGRASGGSSYGCEGRCADRATQFARSIVVTGRRREGVERLLREEWRQSHGLCRHLAGRFLAIAQETKCLDEADCEHLKEMWSALEDDRPEGFTSEEHRADPACAHAGESGTVSSIYPSPS